MKGKNVFVVLYHSEWENSTSSSDVLGVYENVEDARKAMKEEIEFKLHSEEWTASEEDTERHTSTDNMTIFDGVGCIDFVSVEVVEKIIK